MPRPNQFYTGRLNTKIAVPRFTKHDADAIPADVRLDFRQQLQNLTPRLPGSVHELRDALRGHLGSNKAVARELGVTPRTLERYIAAEEHKASQQRGLTAERRGALTERLRGLLAPLELEKRYAQLRQHGATITGDFLLAWSEDASWRTVTVGHIPPEAFANRGKGAGIVQRMERGHWNKAADEVARAFLDSYNAGGASLEGARDLRITIS